MPVCRNDGVGGERLGGVQVNFTCTPGAAGILVNCAHLWQRCMGNQEREMHANGLKGECDKLPVASCLFVRVPCVCIFVCSTVQDIASGACVHYALESVLKPLHQ
jgi:hypothetical protein